MPGAYPPTMQSIKPPREDCMVAESCHEQEEASPTSILLIATVCSLNTAMSIALITFNKYLMSPGRFPYPLPLVTLHCAVSLFLIGGLLLLHRCFGNGGSEFFSSLPRALSGSSALKRRIALIALFYSIQLVVSNAAYLYSSMVFIQMMKEANIAFVYLGSIAVALEAINLQRFKALALIIFATYLTIRGEINFTWLGFCVQGTGQIFEVGRIVFSALLLCGSAKLDVFTYVLFVTPVCFALLGGFLAINLSLMQPLEFVDIPSYGILMEWWPVLLLNSCMAFALTMTTTLTVKYASAMGLIFTGLVKDTIIILCGAFLFKEHVSLVQVVGFILQMFGILVYSLVKLHPDKFEDGLSSGIKASMLSAVIHPCLAMMRKARKSLESESVPETEPVGDSAGKKYGSLPLNA